MKTQTKAPTQTCRVKFACNPENQAILAKAVEASGASQDRIINTALRLHTGLPPVQNNGDEIPAKFNAAFNALPKPVKAIMAEMRSNLRKALKVEKPGKRLQKQMHFWFTGLSMCTGCRPHIVLEAILES